MGKVLGSLADRLQDSSALRRFANHDFFANIRS